MPHFADILLPLALENTLTYGIPTDLQLTVGQRDRKSTRLNSSHLN